MNLQGSLVETAQEESSLRSTMKDDPPQPKISFLRTKRFWLRWAVPGLLLALWVEGMLFAQSFRTSFSGSTHFLGLGEGNLCLESYSTITKWSATGSNSWNYSAFSYKSSWSPGVELFPHFRREFESAERFGIIMTTRIFKIPLWLPLILWLLASHLWSRHQKRKQAEHP
jgi:hypothetical protein